MAFWRREKGAPARPKVLTLAELRDDFERYVAAEVAANPGQALDYGQGIEWARQYWELAKEPLTLEEAAALIDADPSLLEVDGAGISLLSNRDGYGIARTVINDIAGRVGLDPASMHQKDHAMSSRSGTEVYFSSAHLIAPALAKSEKPLTWAELVESRPGYVKAALGIDSESPEAIAAVVYPKRLAAFLHEVNYAHSLVIAHNDQVRAQEAARPHLGALETAAAPASPGDSGPELSH